MKRLLTFLICILALTLNAQDLSTGYITNDLDSHPMQDIEKPNYLESIIDPSFQTKIVRITDAGSDEVIAPIYSTIQAWNADETRLLVYTSGNYQLLNGHTYEYISGLSEISPADIETVFWHFQNPEILFYHEGSSNDFISFNIE